MRSVPSTHALRRVVLGNGLAGAGAQCFPLKEADPVHALRGAREQERQELVGIGRRGGDQIEVRRHALVERGAIEAFLVVEVVVQHPLVHGRGARDHVDARAGEPLGHEFAPGGAKDALASTDRVAARSNHLDTRPWP